MGVQRDCRAVAEAMTDDQIGGRDHAVGLAKFRRHDMALDGEPKVFEPFRRLLGVRRTIARRIVGRDLHQAL